MVNICSFYEKAFSNIMNHIQDKDKGKKTYFPHMHVRALKHRNLHEGAYYNITSSKLKLLMS